jgi:glucosamine--fructose-6-phosphate aminotransferase (isomerizing)
MVQMWNEIQEQPAALQRCLTTNCSLIQTIAALLRKRQVQFAFIAARGTSDHAAVYGKYVIEAMTGIPVALAAPSILTVYQKKMNFGNNLVLGISQSGKAEDVLEIIREANQNGAITVTITNNLESPLAKEAQFHLYCNANLEESVAATKTFTTQMMLLAQLATEWADAQGVKQELLMVPDLVNRTLELSEVVIRNVHRYSFIKECFVLARGINYAIALETALKMQETTYIRAKGFSTSDFQHGPIAMAEKEIPFILFAPSGPSFPYVEEMAHRLTNNGAELIVVSNRQEIINLGSTGFLVPDTQNDIISPFPNIVIAQMFVCQLALAKGLNPDKPRNLKKVTVTR